MAKLSASVQIDKIVKNLSKAMQEAASPIVFKRLGLFSIDIIVKRTRLGYGVDKFLGTKQRLAPLKESYIAQRKKSKLAGTTTPKKSNLTRTGQMLASMDIIRQTQRSVAIGPTGHRNDSPHSNEEIAGYNADRGRVFNQVSLLEFRQIVREYRRSFGDLLKKRRLLK